MAKHGTGRLSQLLHTLQIIVLGLVAAASASPTYPVKSTYGYSNGGGSYVVRSQIHCIPGEPCGDGVLLDLPTVPAGGSFRTEHREPIIHKSKREANPSVQSAYSYGNGGSYAQLSQVNCLLGDPCELPTIPTRPAGGPFRYEFRHHAKAN